MLMARPLCQILEPIVARKSKSLPTPGVECRERGGKREKRGWGRKVSRE